MVYLDTREHVVNYARSRVAVLRLKHQCGEGISRDGHGDGEEGGVAKGVCDKDKTTADTAAKKEANNKGHTGTNHRRPWPLKGMKIVALKFNYINRDHSESTKLKDGF